MGKQTNIQWCDHTFNPWRGCRKVAPECANCYITTTVPFRTTGQKHGSVRVRAGESYLKEPLKWNRLLQEHNDKHGDNVRHRVFCLSLGDWLDDENVPIEWLADLLKTIHDTPNLDWLLLTKRPKNFFLRVGQVAQAKQEGFAWEWSQRSIPPSNVWIGVSAGADQAAAVEIPARVHFLSCEPMLKPMDVTHARRFTWIIFGGESGKGARPCYQEWIREGLEFCRNRNIAAFVKQLGANSVTQDTKESTWRPFKDKKGGDMSEWPEDLRVREFPTP